MHETFINFSIQTMQTMSGRIETCLGKLTDEQIWWRGAEAQNAVGNLVLHLCGNVGQWIVAGIGGAPDTRQRDAEFATRGDVSKEELVSRLRERVEQAAGVLKQVREDQLEKRIKPQNLELTVLEAIYKVVEHFSHHTGQIIYATKLHTSQDLQFYPQLAPPPAHREPTP